MNQCEETEEGVHPSETPLCGQHDNQTKAQSQGQETDVVDWFDSMDWFMTRFSQPHQEQETDVVDWFMTRFFQPHWLDFSESLFSHPLKDVATADRDSVLSLDSGISLERKVSSKYRHVSSKNKPVIRIEVPFRAAASLSHRLDFSESPFSHLLKDVATADRYSVLSLDSGLGSLESLSSDSGKDSFRSSDSRPEHKCALRAAASAPVLDSLESLSSDLKKDSFRSSDRRMSLGRKDSSGSSCESGKNPEHKCALRAAASAPVRLDFSESPFSHPLKDVATADGDAVLSSDSGKPVMRIEVPFRAAASLSHWLDFSESPFLHPLKDVATADRYSVLSSDSGISLERKVSSKYRHVSSKNKPVMRIEVPFRAAASLSHRPDFVESPASDSEEDVATADGDSVFSSDSWEKEKTTPPPPKSLLLEVVLR